MKRITNMRFDIDELVTILKLIKDHESLITEYSADADTVKVLKLKAKIEKGLET